jgi:hypothetical protein
MIQQSAGADSFAGPLPIAVLRPMEASVPISQSFPAVIRWSDKPASQWDWIFTAEMSTAAATRRLGLIASNLAKASLNPGSNPLILTVGVRYPAGGGADLRRVPVNVAGGELFDADTNATLPVFGVSEYEVDQAQTPRTKDIVALQTYNPFYSASIFGTRVHLAVNNAQAAISTGDQQTQLNTFTIPRKDLDKRFFGLYVVTALDPQGVPLHISRREIIGDTMLVVVDGQLDMTKATTFVVLTHRTAQAAVNPPVKGLTALEETVLVGPGLLNDIQGDPRFTVASARYNGTDSILVLYANNMRVKGFAGTDFTTLIWVRDISGKFVARECTVELFGGIATVTVAKANVTTSQWFLVASVLPSPSSNSRLMLTSVYIPYQGEGVEGRDYTLVYAPEEGWAPTLHLAKWSRHLAHFSLPKE